MVERPSTAFLFLLFSLFSVVLRNLRIHKRIERSLFVESLYLLGKNKNYN
ncbi:hypothetical protein HMPREF1990_00816 [Porphyromonas gingivalis W4087]|nr:hypothetical protein A343_1006 [Porphyromonas gingivalis JCVI SC001]ERJ67085.1 hypothetical protein HMPREF1553_01550 [Porphyromonas gingivalis F0568]ERJ89692.1 hypothetical protein HMPREF1990_00816 [Porphyromonas gingivalis W4087]